MFILEIYATQLSTKSQHVIVLSANFRQIIGVSTVDFHRKLYALDANYLTTSTSDGSNNRYRGCENITISASTMYTIIIAMYVTNIRFWKGTALNIRDYVDIAMLLANWQINACH